MRDPQTDPAVRRRLSMASYASNHTQAATARYFGCCWKTVQATLRRMAAYEQSGQIQVLQNTPRGKSRRTAPGVEDQVIALYQESATPPRPSGRRYSAAKVARLCRERHHLAFTVRRSGPFCDGVVYGRPSSPRNGPCHASNVPSRMTCGISI
jgi:hypothetical protein